MSDNRETEKYEQVIQRLFPHTSLLKTWPLTGGMSAQMTALELRQPDGQIRRVIVRIPGTAEQYELLKHLHASGLRVQQVYDFDASGDIFPTPYLVLEYVEGKPEFAPSDLDGFIRPYAAQLASIHQVDHSAFRLDGLKQRSFAERLQALTVNPEPSPDGQRIRQALAQAASIDQWNTPVLVHGDFWPGNVLWHEGRLAAVIDWEDAETGDPLADLAVSRLDTLLIFGIRAMHDFTAHYQSQMSDSISFANLPYWDLLAALRAVPHLGEWPVMYPAVGRADITEASMREGHHWFVRDALERLSV